MSYLLAILVLLTSSLVFGEIRSSDFSEEELEMVKHVVNYHVEKEGNRPGRLVKALLDQDAGFHVDIQSNQVILVISDCRFNYLKIDDYNFKLLRKRCD